MDAVDTIRQSIELEILRFLSMLKCDFCAQPKTTLSGDVNDSSRQSIFIRISQRRMNLIQLNPINGICVCVF